MLFTGALIASLLAAVASAAPAAPSVTGPFTFPLSNGFPAPAATNIPIIEANAGGSLSNGPPPSAVLANGLTNLKLIALNELFEVAFFTELLHNITNGVDGYTSFGQFTPSFVHEALFAVRAQEELHLLNANGALAHFGAAPIQPCKYVFPVSTFDEAIALAATFTDVVLGTLQDVQSIFAQDGGAEAAGLVPAVGSVIGQEGEQNGFYRILQGKKPSSSPFLTRGTRDFAFTAIQDFVVPGSCPNIDTIPLQTFGKLNVLSTAQAANSTLDFSVQGTVSETDNSIAYISGQNLPVSVPLQNVQVKYGVTTFSAEFPFESGFADGLTIAALVKGQGPFTSADAVAESTAFGPGLIEVN